MFIEEVTAREILDSRGNPTVEVSVYTEEGVQGSARVPSGASTGAHEAVELRDGDPRRYGGKGVLKAVKNVNTEIAKALKGAPVTEQRVIDRAMCELDGTPNKGRLGANAILGVSLAVARAAAESLHLPLYRYLGGPNAHLLPVPMFNILNGGKHAPDSTDFQEFMVMPAGAETFSDGLCAWVWRSTTPSRRCCMSRDTSPRSAMKAGSPLRSPATSPRFRSCSKRSSAPATARARMPSSPSIPRPPSSTATVSTRSRKRAASSAASRWSTTGPPGCDKYPIRSIEDGLAEDDWDGWAALTERLGDRCQVVGDDLLVTNPERIRRGVAKRAANTVLVKLNQIGTLSETIEAVDIAQRSGWTAVISHRSGETEDTFIADLAVATGAGQIKTGAPARSERTAKYNRLLEIEAELATSGMYAGWDSVRQLGPRPPREEAARTRPSTRSERRHPRNRH